MSSFRVEDFDKLRWTPTKDQVVAIELLPSNKGFVVADVTGKGKTYAAICSFAVLQKYNKDAHLLVLSTKSSLSPWRKDLTQGTYYDFLEFTVSSPKLNLLTAAPYDVSVMTYTAVKKFPDYLRALFREKFVIIVADEFHKAASPKSHIGGVVRYLKQFAEYFWGLTATPMGNKIESLYHLIEIIRPGFLGYSYYQFQRKYCLTKKTIVPVLGSKGNRKFRKITEIIGYRNLDTLGVKLKQVMLRRDLDLRINFHRKIAELTESEERMYLVAARGCLGRGFKQFAARLPDLQLVVNNACNLEKEPNENFKTVSSKEWLFFNLCKEILSRPEPLVVFTSSRWTQTRLMEIVARSLLPAGIISNLFQINGNTSDKARFKISSVFGGSDLLIMTPAGGESLNLQAAGSICFYDTPFDLRQFVQAAGRVARMDTEFNCIDVYLLEALGTIDSYKSLMILSNAQTFEGVLKGTSALPKSVGKVTKALLKRMRERLLWRIKGRVVK